MKEEKDKKTLKILIKRLMYYRPKIIIICCFYFLLTVLTFFRPMMIRNITDKGMVDRNLGAIIFFSVLLLVISIIEQIVEVTQTKLFIKLQNDMELSLYKEAFQKLLRLKWSYFTDKNNTEIVTKLTMDIDRVSMIADRGIMFLLNYSLRIVSGLIGLFIVSWKLALLVIIIIPIKCIIVKLLANKKQKLMHELIENSRDFNAWFGDNINGIREIKLWNLHKEQFYIFNKKQQKLISQNAKSGMLDAYNLSFDVLLEWGLNCILYSVGGYLVCKNELSIGGVIAFLSYSSYVTDPISAILNMNFIFAGILPSAKRLFEFYELEEEPIDSGKFMSTEEIKSIQFQHVNFSYGEETLLENIELSINGGEKIAIVGSNGSGKTTIINLLLRFITPQNGKILLNGKDIGLYDFESYRNLFSVVSQEPHLFQDTILHNLDLQKTKTKDEINSACKQIGIDKLINKLPKKMQTMVGRNGMNFSGGERQKIAVARAIVKNSPLVILDEATSNYDVESDTYLHKTLLNEFKDKTVILITHRYDNLKGLDRIFRLEQGILTEVNI